MGPTSTDKISWPVVVIIITIVNDISRHLTKYDFQGCTNTGYFS